MKNKKILYISIVLGLILCSTAFFAYTEFNRKAKNMKELSTDIIISSEELINAFALNDKQGNNTYQNKVLLVKGKFKNLEQIAGNRYSLLLGDSSSNISIRCSMDSGYHPIFNYKVGQLVKIKGAYTGFNADDLGLGADILLNKCIISQ
jgi:plasmid maintenance system killer protein